MKKAILLILFIFGSYNCFSLNYLHVQGLVSNSANGLGIPNHKIYITDNNYYNDSILTGSNGYYTLLITNVNANTKYIVSVKDCNNILHSDTANSNTQINVINFSICDNFVMNCQNTFTYIKQSNTSFSFSGSNISTYPTIYYWDFGDGTTAVGQNVNHIYSQPGSASVTYIVSLFTRTFYTTLDTCSYQSSQNIIVTDSSLKIRGKVTAADSTIQNAWVCLFGVNNPIGSCNAIDTAYLDNQGNYIFSNFPVNYPAYILRAEFPYNSLASNYYIPAYYDTLYSWMNSPPVYPKSDTTVYNIQFIDILPNQATGSGTISGSISSTGGTIPASVLGSIDILLINQNNQVLKLQKANSQGIYSFQNLPFDNYSVFIELTGKISFPENVNLSISNPYINNLNFVINDNVISLSINDESDLTNSISEIYPNPANQQAYIDFSLKNADNIHFMIYNQIGQLILQKSEYIEKGNQRIYLDISNINTGFYTVRISNKSQILSRKLIKY